MQPETRDGGPAAAPPGPAVVLLSGGLDSSTLLYHVRAEQPGLEVLALSFRYGQRHARELEAARWQAARAEAVRHDVIDISFFGAITGAASALTGLDRPVPRLAELDAEQRRQPPTYVPHRNLVLLSLAAAHAESAGARHVYYGAQAQDEYGYWDCTADFLQRLNAVLALNRRDAVRVHAPFLALRKSAIVKIGLALGVDYAHTWSCYCGGPVPCGACPTCVERAVAFREAGAADPLAAGVRDAGEA